MGAHSDPWRCEAASVALRLGGQFDRLGEDPACLVEVAKQSARLLELISPAGFEHYFRELAPLLRQQSGTRPPSARSSPATSSTSTSTPSPCWPSSTARGKAGSSCWSWPLPVDDRAHRRVAGELSVAAVPLAGASVDIDGAQRSS
jgi:hypothetical protein